MSRPPSERTLWIATLAAFAALLALAGMRRAEILDAVVAGDIESASPRLAGDAASYESLARRTPFPCFSTEREPGILFAGKFALAVFGGASEDADQLVLRRTALALGLLAMTALFGCALLVAGRAGALVAALLWADNPWLALYGVGFLREDFAAAFLLAMLAALVSLFRAENRRARIALAAAAAAAGALMALTRLEGLGTATLLVLAWTAARAAAKRLTRADALLAGAAVAGLWLLVSPYLIFNAAKTGSPLHPMHAHARFWRNHEFAGQPGYPTRADVVANSYCGPPETPAHYVWGRHSVPEVAGREIAGLWKGFTRDLPRLLVDRAWIAWLVPVGALALVVRRRWEGAFVLAAGVLALLPFAFILTIDTVLTVEPAGHPGVEPRFALPTLPFAFLWLAGGVGAAVAWLRRRRGASPAAPAVTAK